VERTYESASAVEMVRAPDAPPPPAPFSHATVVGNLVFTSGMGGLDPRAGQVVSDDVREQTRQALNNTLAILRAAGCSMDDVVRMTVYLTDMADYAIVNEIYAEFVGDHRPARTCVAVSALPLRERMKIEATAVRASSR
jgi:2-iminobutanoate/2-iminopropanoate deaminase